MKDLTDLGLRPGERVFVDRIENGVATLLLGDEARREENVPADQLPDGAEGGQRFRVRTDGGLEADPAATDAGRAAVRSLMDELLGQSGEET